MPRLVLSIKSIGLIICISLIVLGIVYFWQISFAWPDTQRCTKGACLTCLGYSPSVELSNSIVVKSCYGFFVNWKQTRVGILGFPTRYASGWGYCSFGVSAKTNNISGSVIERCYGFYQPLRSSVDPILVQPLLDIPQDGSAL